MSRSPPTTTCPACCDRSRRRVGLLVDDETLHVDVVNVDELVSDTPLGHAKPTAYNLARFVLPIVMDGADVIKVGELSALIAGQIQARYSVTISPGHVQKVIIPTLLRNQVLDDVVVSGNEHKVSVGEQFPERWRMTRGFAHLGIGISYTWGKLPT